MSGITTHVLDVALGTPVSGLRVGLARYQDATWQLLGHAETDSDGRVRSFGAFEPGRYRLSFETESYFNASQRPTFYGTIEIAFNVTAPEQHYHVPLLLSPFGYSTYRGQ